MLCKFRWNRFINKNHVLKWGRSLNANSFLCSITVQPFLNDIHHNMNKIERAYAVMHVTTGGATTSK